VGIDDRVRPGADMTVSTNQLVEALVQMPQSELVEVIATALAQRTGEVARPEWHEARLCLAEAHRQHEGSNQPSDWDVLLFARAQNPEDHMDDGSLQEGGHCGHTLRGYAKQVICPICGKPASLT
jgi:rubrerythrin